MYGWRIATLEELHEVRNLALIIWPHTFADVLTQKQIDYMLNWMYSIETLESKFQLGHQFKLLTEDDRSIGFAHLEIGFPKSRLFAHSQVVFTSQ